MRDHRANAVILRASGGRSLRNAGSAVRRTYFCDFLTLTVSAVTGTVLGALVVLAMAWLVGFGSILSVSVALTIFLPVLVVVTYLSAVLVGRLRLGWWIRRRLALAECAGCTFSLTGLTPDLDGCSVCPECGAAWRLPSPDA